MITFPSSVQIYFPESYSRGLEKELLGWKNVEKK